MENALFVEYREGHKVSYENESTIHMYQRRANCSYEEAIAHEGYTFYGQITGKLFSSCRLYIMPKGNTFHRGYIDVAFHPLSGCDEPIHLHQLIYMQDFILWVEMVNTLAATPGSRMHQAARESMLY